MRRWWVPWVWVAAFLGALLTDAMLLLVGAKGAGGYAEGFCVAGGRGPAAEVGYGVPQPVDPGRLRCDYTWRGHHTSVVYTEWFPFVMAALGFLLLLAVLVTAAMLARLLLRRHDAARAQAFSASSAWNTR